MASTKEMTVRGEEALKIAEALNATTMRMLQVLGTEGLDVTTIAKKVGLSEAYISEQVRQLEELKLISVSYQRGKRGIRKVCKSDVERVTLVIVDHTVSKRGNL
jgi:predicted transcriptional regulator